MPFSHLIWLIPNRDIRAIYGGTPVGAFEENAFGHQYIDYYIFITMLMVIIGKYIRKASNRKEFNPIS